MRGEAFSARMRRARRSERTVSGMDRPAEPRQIARCSSSRHPGACRLTSGVSRPVFSGLLVAGRTSEAIEVDPLEKLIYVAHKDGGDPIEDYRERLLHEASSRILQAGVAGLTLCIADVACDPRVDPQRLFGHGASIAASCSIWLESLDERAPIEEALRDAGSRIDGYLVTESVPQPYPDRSWSDGERSVGITQICAFPQPERLSDDEFFRLWHDEHTPFSFSFHPRRWRYERNVVARVLTPGAPPYRGIVYESWPELEDFLDPDRYVPKEMRELTDERVDGFVGYDALDLTVTSEFILKTFPPDPRGR